MLDRIRTPPDCIFNNKPLPEPILTKISDISLGHDELSWSSGINARWFVITLTSLICVIHGKSTFRLLMVWHHKKPKHLWTPWLSTTVYCYFFKIGMPELIIAHCGLVTSYANIELCEDWLRWWLVAWRHHAIIWTNINYSCVIFCGINLTSFYNEYPSCYSVKWIWKLCMYFQNWLHVPGDSELISS